MNENLITITHERVYLPEQTLGSWYESDKALNREPLCKVLELPWLDNANNISCIPEGKYLVTNEPPILKGDKWGRKERPYQHFRIHDVPGRRGILVHRITYVKDLKGCQGVGSRFMDINKDGILDIEGSSRKLEWLTQYLPERFWLKIIKKP